MKWTYSIKNKTTAAILLAVILGLTMLTNLLQRKRFKELEASFASIYEDRLLAESYLFHLYVDLKKEEDILQAATESGISYSDQNELDQDRADRDQIMSRYSETYLTDEEQIQFNSLKSVLNRINGLEKEIKMQQASGMIPPELLEAHEAVTTEAFATISALSDIQTAEGEALRNKSKQIFLGSVSISHFEMTILIVIAIVIQALIFSSNTLLQQKNQQAHLN